MADITSSEPIATRLSKRKRAQVSYYEADAGEDSCTESQLEADNDIDVESDSESVSDEYSPNKRVKAKLASAASVRAKVTTAGKAKALPGLEAKRLKRFPFMSLPRELRNAIYDMALKDDSHITLVCQTKAYRRKVARGPVPDFNGAGRSRHRINLAIYHPSASESGQHETGPSGLIPNLLAVSKAIRAEASGILYGQPIVLRDTMALHHFLAQIGLSNRLLLRDVEIRGWGKGRGVHKAMNFASLTLLAGATNIKRLAFMCMIGVNKPHSLARQLFRDGHHFFEAFAAANGKKATLDVLAVSGWNFGTDSASPVNSVELLPKSDKRQVIFRGEMMKLLN